MKNFLSAEDHQKVVMRTLEREREFEISKTDSDIPDHRRSLVLVDDDIIGPLFRGKVQLAVAEVASSLGLNVDKVPEHGSIECQITAHRHAGFYHAHNDSGSPNTMLRVLTYVYYFQTRPHAFYAGELKLYQPLVENGVDVTGSEYYISNQKIIRSYIFQVILCTRFCRRTFLPKPFVTRDLQ